MRSPERLFRTDDGRIVPAEHPESAFLVAGEGCEVPAEYVDVVSAYLAPPVVKEAEQAPNKALPAPANKARRSPAKK